MDLIRSNLPGACFTTRESLPAGTWQIIGIAAELKCEGDDMFLCRHLIQEYASSLETTLILRKQK